jgi:UDP-2,3-diacylglucosamine pyrophosphatase LpxH
MIRLVISDLHLGSKYCREDDLINFLKSIKYDQLILAGDIIDFIKIPSFTKKTIEFFKAIDYSKDIVYIIGNHDHSLYEFAGQELFGIKFMNRYDFVSGGRKIRVEHGDSYEGGISKLDFMMKIISICHDWLERTFKIDLASWYVGYKIKRRKLRRIWDILKWNDDADVFIMGHAHCPEAIIWVDENQSIKTYVNSGDWVAHSSYIIIDDGVVRLKKYEP